MNNIPPTSFSTTPPPLGDSPENYRYAYVAAIQNYAATVSDPKEKALLLGLATTFYNWAHNQQPCPPATSVMQEINEILAAPAEYLFSPPLSQFPSSLNWYLAYTNSDCTPDSLATLISNALNYNPALPNPTTDPSEPALELPAAPPSDLTSGDINFLNALMADKFNPATIVNLLADILTYYSTGSSVGPESNNIIYEICAAYVPNYTGDNISTTIMNALYIAMAQYMPKDPTKDPWCLPLFEIMNGFVTALGDYCSSGKEQSIPGFLLFYLKDTPTNPYTEKWPMLINNPDIYAEVGFYPPSASWPHPDQILQNALQSFEKALSPTCIIHILAPPYPS